MTIPDTMVARKFTSSSKRKQSKCTMHLNELTISYQILTVELLGLIRFQSLRK